jgi:hypothetical protein
MRINFSSLSEEYMDNHLIEIDKEIKDYKIKIGETKFDHAFKVFKEFSANPDTQKSESRLLSQYFCTEKSIIDNF